MPLESAQLFFESRISVVEHLLNIHIRLQLVVDNPAAILREFQYRLVRKPNSIFESFQNSKKGLLRFRTITINVKQHTRVENEHTFVPEPLELFACWLIIAWK